MVELQLLCTRVTKRARELKERRPVITAFTRSAVQLPRRKTCTNDLEKQREVGEAEILRLAKKKNNNPLLHQYPKLDWYITQNQDTVNHHAYGQLITLLYKNNG